MQGVPQSIITALLWHQEDKKQKVKPQNVDTQADGQQCDQLPLPLVRWSQY